MLNHTLRSNTNSCSRYMQSWQLGSQLFAGLYLPILITPAAINFWMLDLI